MSTSDKLSVKSLPIPGLAELRQAYPVADRNDAAIVACAGAPYGEASNTGIAVVGVSAEGIGHIEHVFQVKSGEAPVYASVTSLGGTHVLAASQDYVNFTGDKAYVVDLASGKTSLVFSAKGAGDLGSGTWSAKAKLLFVPDAGLGVRVFHGDAQGLKEGDAIRLDSALPAHAVRPLIGR